MAQRSIAFGLCIGFAVAQQVERGPLQDTVFHSVKNKPETAIGISGMGYTEGWTIRLDDFIAVGFPEGSTAYTKDGGKVLLKGALRPVSPIVQAVGTVTDIKSITEDLGVPQVLAYCILMQ